jgi:hypothetical protein
MYFDSIPNLRLATVPNKYPFSKGDYVIAKNFFKRYILDEKVFPYAVFYNKYTIKDTDRLDLIAEKYYGDPFYDWVILLTNNMINGVYDWPLDTESFEKKMESFDDPFNTIHHYETYFIEAGYEVDGLQVIAQQEGLMVGEENYLNDFSFWNGSYIQTIPGSETCRPISVYEYEYNKNEKKRTIYILKNRYLQSFVDAFKRNNQYSKSEEFISNNLKNTTAPL